MVSGSPIMACMKRAERHRQDQQNALEESHSKEIQRAVSPSNDIAADSDRSSPPTAASSPSHEGSKEKHYVHHVLTISTRAFIVNWMMTEAATNGERHIASKAICQFSHFFRSSSNANITQASRSWKARLQYVNDEGDASLRGTTSTLTRITKGGPKRVQLKARAGRGCKRAEWVYALHSDLRDEFDRLRKLGVKFNLTALRHLVLDMLRASENEAHTLNMVDPRSQLPLHLKINLTLIQSFAELFRIFSRAHKRKHRMSLEKEFVIEVDAATHLGTVSGLLSSRTIDENDIENAHETDFVFNVDNGLTFGFSGTDGVKYADVVSGDEGFTMVVCISGGS